jgi:hypothetical protein
MQYCSWAIRGGWCSTGRFNFDRDLPVTTSPWQRWVIEGQIMAMAANAEPAYAALRQDYAMLEPLHQNRSPIC